MSKKKPETWQMSNKVWSNQVARTFSRKDALKLIKMNSALALKISTNPSTQVTQELHSTNKRL